MKHNFTADGNSTEFTIYPEKILNIFADGTFGSGTVKLQIENNDGVWFDASGISFTSKALKLYQNGSFAFNARLNLSGSTSPDIDVEVLG